MTTASENIPASLEALLARVEEWERSHGALHENAAVALRDGDPASREEAGQSASYQLGKAHALMHVADLLRQMLAAGYVMRSCCEVDADEPDPVRDLASQIACSPTGAGLVALEHVPMGGGLMRPSAERTADNILTVARRILGTT